MSSTHTESTSISLSSTPEMETQLMSSESPEEDEENPMKNPFALPPDIDVFSIRHEEIKKAKAERERMKTMKIHEKITYSTKIKAKPKGLIKALQKEEEEEPRKQATKEERLKTFLESPSWKTAIKNNYSLGKETLRDYINNRREVFLLKYTMAVMRDEIQRMENAVKNEERKVEEAEYDLDKNIAMFNEFLKEGDKIWIQVMKNGEKQSAARRKKTRELQAIRSQIDNLQSDIFRFKDTLQEYKMYRDFLYQLSPKKWQEEHGKKHTKEKDLKITFKTNEESASPPSTAEQGQGLTVEINAASPYHISYTDLPSSLLSSKCLEISSLYEMKPLLKNFLKSLSTRKLSSLEDAESETCSDEDEQPELYFTDPQQLLSIFTEMKEENFSFLLNSQETKESLNEVQRTFIMTYERREKELAELKQQVVTLKSSITKEKERLADLKLKVHHLTSGEHKADDQDKMLTSLNEKVLDVYCHWTGENETNLQTLQMLAVLEKQVIYLLDDLERMPPEKLQQAEKAREKEYRRRCREEKLRQQEQQQEEKFQKVLERLQRSMKNKSTTKPAVHSSPPVRKKHSQEQMDKEKEEQLYYFT